MTCPRCDGPATTETLQQFGGVCAKCLLDFTAEKDAPAFPGLEIEKVIGEGGMGVVYKAVQKQLGRTVALKVLSPALASDPQFVERFTREAKALAQLSHPNIVAIHEFGVHDGVPFLVMEYVEGTPLRKLLAAGKLTPERALQVVPQICDALAYAHARGVVHRDVKPENILLDREGRVKIADFGLAKLAEPGQTRITRTQMVMGTPNYMAPEQIENPSTVDHRADIYSLGVVFYEMLTGELPLGRFKAPSEKASVDARLDPVVMRTLEKDPGDRYQQAGEVKDEVTRVRALPPELRSPAQPEGAAGRARLAGPATGLMVTGILNLLTVPFVVVSAVTWAALGAEPPPVFPPGTPPAAPVGLSVVSILLALIPGLVWIVTAILVLVASRRMREGRGLGLCTFASILAMIPCTSPFFLVGVPVGIWALVTLSKSEVRAVFSLRIAPAPAPGRRRASPLAHACLVLLALGLGAVILGLFLPVRIGGIVFIVGAALLVATLVLSLISLIQIAASRGTLRGAGLASLCLAGSLLALLAFPFLLFLPSSAPAEPARPRVVSRPSAPAPAAPLRLAQVWPEEAELPVGLAFQSQMEGAEALKEAKLPPELMADLEEARYAIVKPGEVELLALRFKSSALEQAWGSKRALEVGNGRWGQGWRDRDRVAFWIGKGKHAEGPVSVALLSADITRRLNAPKPAPVRPRYSTLRLVPQKSPFKIGTAWPGAEDLQGLAKEREGQGAKALYEAGLPEAMFGDMAAVHRCLFLDGRLELLGLEFKGEIPRSRWLAHLGFSSTQEGSLSFFVLSYAGGVETDAVARAVERVLRKKLDPATPPDEPVPAPLADFRIADAWPREGDLPEGLSLAEPKEGDEAFRSSGLPAAAKADLESIRSVRVMPGNAFLCACEFKTKLARLRWELENPVRGAVLDLPGGVPAAGGRSVVLWTSDGKPESTAAHKLLLPILNRRIREAAAIDAKRPK